MYSPTGRPHNLVASRRLIADGESSEEGVSHVLRPKQRANPTLLLIRGHCCESDRLDTSVRPFFVPGRQLLEEGANRVAETRIVGKAHSLAGLSRVIGWTLPTSSQGTMWLVFFRETQVPHANMAFTNRRHTLFLWPRGWWCSNRAAPRSCRPSRTVYPLGICLCLRYQGRLRALEWSHAKIHGM